MIFRLFLFASILFFSTHIVCFAKDLDPEKGSDLALEVFQMSQSLDALAQQLKSQQALIDENQKLQSAISYLSFRSRSIEMMQYELRFKKERQQAYERNIERTKEEIDKLQGEQLVLQTNARAVTTNDIRDKEERLKRMQDGLEDLNSEIIKTENEIQASKDELLTFEAFVRERLDLIN